DVSIPIWRTRVLYVPQRPPIIPGTPLDYLKKIRSFKAQQNDTIISKSENKKPSLMQGDNNGSVKLKTRIRVEWNYPVSDRFDF
ncbi:245_t:CDS:2, partial [Entrophospora sp. SA101]